MGNFLAILETEFRTYFADDSVSLSDHSFFAAVKEKLQEKLQEEGLSKETSRLLSHLTNSYHKEAVEISQNEWFNETKDAVKRWVNYLLKKRPASIIFVQKKLLGLAKEKSAIRNLLLLLFYFQEERDRLLAQGLWGKKINHAIEAALQAQKIANQCLSKRWQNNFP